MSTDREQLETLFEAARNLAGAAERQAFIETSCGGDAELRRAVEDLLAAGTEAEEFFAECGPALEVDDARQELRGLVGDKPPGEDLAAELRHTIGPYRLREKLGEGGCGVVYVAEQDQPVKRRVALKLIKPGMDTRQVVARFGAERQALALMDHPGIAKVFDAGTTAQGRPYFVMELVSGVRITEYCQRARLSTHQRVELFVRVCHAVQHAHQKGIIHRDLKPSNIIVAEQDGLPAPKVIDFGIAKALEGQLANSTLHTELRQFIGTPAYTSPEQAQSGGSDIDTRSDIYSLGVLLYELLTGAPPFDPTDLARRCLEDLRRTLREVEPQRPSTRLSTLAGAQLTQVANNQQTEPPRLLSAIRGDLDWVVMKCLEKDRDRRYATAHEVAMDLQRFLRREPVLARPPSLVYRARRFAERNKVVFTATAVTLLALVAGLALTSWALVRERVARRDAESARGSERQQRLRAEAQELAARRFAYASDITLAQQALAANNLARARELLARNEPGLGQSDLRGWEWRYLWGRCQSDSLFKLGREAGSIMALAPLNESGGVVARDIGGAVIWWNVREQRKVSEFAAAGFGRALAVSANGSRLAFSSANPQGRPTIQLHDAATPNDTRVIEGVAAALALALSPDGRMLAAFCADRTLRVWDGTVGALKFTLPASREDGIHKGTLCFSPDGARLAVGETDGRVRLIDPAEGKVTLGFKAAAEGITALAFSPDGALLATGSGFADRSIRLWDAAKGELVGTLRGHTSWVGALAFALDGKTLASGSGDQTIRLWDLKTLSQASLLRGHLDEVYALCFAENGTRLVSGAKDGEVRVWDALRRIPSDGCVFLPAPVFKFAFPPGGRDLVTLNRDGKVTAWDLETGELKNTIATVRGDGEMAVSSDGRWLAVGDEAGQLRVWDYPGSREEASFRLAPGRPLSVLFAGSRSECLLVIDAERRAHLWESGTWKQVESWEVDRNANAAGISPDGRVLVCGRGDGRFSAWRVPSGERILEVAAHSRVITGVAFSPDGKRFATTSEDGLTKIWDSATYEVSDALRGSLLSIHSVAFSPDGQRLVTGSSGGEAAQIWDLATKQQLATLTGRGSFFYRIAFAPDNRVLVTVNIDGLFHVWRAEQEGKQRGKN